jgi:hypothetical protein
LVRAGFIILGNILAPFGRSLSCARNKEWRPAAMGVTRVWAS